MIYHRQNDVIFLVPHWKFLIIIFSSFRNHTYESLWAWNPVTKFLKINSLIFDNNIIGPKSEISLDEPVLADPLGSREMDQGRTEPVPDPDIDKAWRNQFGGASKVFLVFFSFFYLFIYFLLFPVLSCFFFRE